jgi:hypothetical protein
VSTAEIAPSVRTAAATLVLLTLASGQFLMTLDSSVMNVSIATVAKDVGTTVTGIQGAITAYTLVMAALMVTGAKVGALIGRKRAFAIGCVIYGCGSLTTALAPNLPVLLPRSEDLVGEADEEDSERCRHERQGVTATWDRYVEVRDAARDLPVTATPRSSRSSHQEAPIAPTTTSSAAGKRLAT